MKQALFLAVTALTLAACAKTYEVEPEIGSAIGFKTWANGMTKARTAGTSTFGNGDSFKVEGYKTISGNNVNVFNNTDVTTTDGTNWTYTNTRYWDSQATSYTFFAVSSPDTALSFDTDGTIDATDVTFSGNDNDILVANSVAVSAPYTTDPVHFVFKHIGAMVDLKVKKAAALSNATVAITGVQLNNIADNGKVAVNGYSTNVPTIDWTELANTSSYTNHSGAEDVETLPTNVTTATDLIKKLIVIPQELGDTKVLSISYTITDGAGNVNSFENVPVKLNQFDRTDNETNTAEFISAWAASTHYTYTLTISANAISFTAEITDWGTVVDGYNYLVD